MSNNHKSRFEVDDFELEWTYKKVHMDNAV